MGLVLNRFGPVFTIRGGGRGGRHGTHMPDRFNHCCSGVSPRDRRIISTVVCSCGRGRAGHLLGRFDSRCPGSCLLHPGLRHLRTVFRDSRFGPNDCDRKHANSAYNTHSKNGRCLTGFHPVNDSHHPCTCRSSIRVCLFHSTRCRFCLFRTLGRLTHFRTTSTVLGGNVGISRFTGNTSNGVLGSSGNCKIPISSVNFGNFAGS